MKHISIRTTGATIGIALALGAISLWPNQAETTSSKSLQIADTDTTHLGHLNVRSLADLFPHGR